ncbi:MAG: tRNA (guanosine(37)-N1)-methyltransferase TrmD [Bacteroidales bacterium]
MHIDILTLFPEMFEGIFGHSILRRAQDKKLVSIECINIRDFAVDKHRRVDDYPYGGGAGMVMMPEPLARCIESRKELRDFDELIFLTPDGIPFDQKIANRLSTSNNLLLLCGHYKGIDQRIRDKYITMELSIGDYVLSGGELAAAVVTDAVVRLLPGVLNDETSALSDSFQDGLLAPPVYTRPASFEGMEVPPVLLSGNDAAIQQWRYEQALQRTQKLRPDLLKEGE